MKVWRKQTTRTKNGKRETIESKRFYGTLKTSDGKRKQIPLTEDRASSETMLRRLQSESDLDRALGVPASVQTLRRPIAELLDEYEQHLKSKSNTSKHIAHTIKRIRSILDGTKTKTLGDLTSSLVAQELVRLRAKRVRPLNTTTSNHYARAIKGFSRWLWIEGRTDKDVLLSLRLLNAKTDRKRERRALSSIELNTLIETTRKQRKKIYDLTPNDRAMLYTVAAYTGLRASELASLKASSIDVERKTITVEAAYSKHRRRDVLPLHDFLIGLLAPWIEKRKGYLWSGQWLTKHKNNAARMIKHDLTKAGIDYCDSQGRYVDFHALRHTFISSLARSGVHPSKAKELARHSTITLTMDVYSHVDDKELRQALGSLPGLNDSSPKEK